MIVFATGFDAVTGAFDRIDIRGVGGVRLRDKWSGGPQTFMGAGTSGFPNLVAVGGPQSGSVAANFPRGIEDMVNWTSEFLRYVRDNGVVRFDANRDAELEWVEHVKGCDPGRGQGWRRAEQVRGSLWSRFAIATSNVVRSIAPATANASFLVGCSCVREPQAEKGAAV